MLDSDNNHCPDCDEKDVSPETLIPNRFLRGRATEFLNRTGYKGGHSSAARQTVTENTTNDQFKIDQSAASVKNENSSSDVIVTNDIDLDDVNSSVVIVSPGIICICTIILKHERYFYFLIALEFSYCILLLTCKNKLYEYVRI